MTVEVREERRSGWRALVLEDGDLRVCVLPDKGADIVELRHLASGVDPLMRTPWGLRPPGAPPREGSGDAAFLHNYEGGWQELFPNIDTAADYRGRRVPFHGEVATLAWQAEPVADGVRLSVTCRATPFSLERTMRLERGWLVLDETVRSRSDEGERFVWGHHCVLGAPFLGAGSRLRLPATTLLTPDQPSVEPTNRLRLGQRGAWPHAELRDGGVADLSLVPGPDAHSHDDVYAGDLAAGHAEVESEQTGLVFRQEWDPAVFGWVVVWQPYGGTDALPLRGTYGLGVEPCSTYRNLSGAIAAGDALALAPGGSLATTLRVALRPA